MQELANVLIVDDEAEVRETIKDILECSGKFRTIIEAKDGKDAIRRYDFQEFELVIIDINMPKMGGLDLIKNIKRHKNSSLSEIIICSGMVDNNIVQKAIAEGVKHVIVKPYDHKELLKKALLALK